MDRQSIRSAFERSLVTEIQLLQSVGHLSDPYELTTAVAKAVFDGLLPGIDAAIQQAVNHHAVQEPHIHR